MNRTELVKALVKRNFASQEVARQVLDDVLGVIVVELERGSGVVSLPGFGTFKVVTRPARAGRNPKTGETIQIEARRVVTFKPSKNMLS